MSDQPSLFPDNVPPPPAPVRVRFRPRIVVDSRCCNCGTKYSHWWGEHAGYPLCGHCAGVPAPAMRSRT